VSHDVSPRVPKLCQVDAWCVSHADSNASNTGPGPSDRDWLTTCLAAAAMTFRRSISFAALTAAPIAIAAITATAACNTTTYVDVPYDGGSDAATAPEPPAAPDATDATSAADTSAPPATGCHPISSAAFTKAPYAPPTAGYQALCSDAQIKAYIGCANGKSADCALLTADGGSSCKTCIESKQSDPTWGPVVFEGKTLRVNEAGCGALYQGDTGTTGCGQGLADYTGCLAFTCRDQCLGSDYFACATEARGTECKSIVNGLKSKCTADVSACFAQKNDTADSLMARIITRFCGAP
jgi:hypothetical protein